MEHRDIDWQYILQTAARQTWASADGPESEVWAGWVAKLATLNDMKPAIWYGAIGFATNSTPVPLLYRLIPDDGLGIGDQFMPYVVPLIGEPDPKFGTVIVTPAVGVTEAHKLVTMVFGVVMTVWQDEYSSHDYETQSDDTGTPMEKLIVADFKFLLEQMSYASRTENGSAT